MLQTTKLNSSSGTKTPTRPATMDTRILHRLYRWLEMDSSLVGTWRCHDDEQQYGRNYSVFFIFRANGTYDMYPGYTGTTPAPPITNNFWRIDSEYLAVLPSGSKSPTRLELFRRSELQKNQPVLVIQWNTGSNDYRAYYPVVKK